MSVSRRHGTALDGDARWLSMLTWGLFLCASGWFRMRRRRERANISSNTLLRASQPEDIHTPPPLFMPLQPEMPRLCLIALDAGNFISWKIYFRLKKISRKRRRLHYSLRYFCDYLHAHDFNYFSLICFFTSSDARDATGADDEYIRRRQRSLLLLIIDGWLPSVRYSCFLLYAPRFRYYATILCFYDPTFRIHFMPLFCLQKQRPPW